MAGHSRIRPSTHVEPHGVTAIARHYVQDLVYGANDGIITTFAVVAGVAGGSLAPAAVLIVGAANLAADGLSMGVGNYLSIRAHESALEAQGLPGEEASPARHGLATFAAFVVAGTVPLAPYLVLSSPGTRAAASIGLTLVALFGVGAARTVVTVGRWWKSGVEVLLLGTVVGIAAYSAGVVVAAVLGKS